MKLDWHVSSRHGTISDGARDGGNRICLLLFLDQELAALLNITAASQRSIRHIGDVFIVVRKAYWNQGLGQILLEEGIEWAHSTGVLRKLVLNVQVRNERAVHLYKN